MADPLTFEDLEVEISSRPDQGLEVRILRSPYNRPREAFDPPYDHDSARELVRSLDDAVNQYLVLRDHRGAEEPAWRGPSLIKVGKDLHQALFQGPLKETLDLSRGSVDGRTAQGEAVGLRLRLSFEASDQAVEAAAILPWELLHDDRGFLAHDRQTPVVRYIDSLRPVLGWEIDLPLRVLLVAANPPIGLKRQVLDLDREKAAILKAVDGDGKIEVETLPEPTLKSLLEALHQKEWPHVLHFMGHGGFDEEGGFVLFEDPTGERALVTDRVLRTVLPQARSLRLVVLAACQGAMLAHGAEGSGLTGVAAGLAQQGLAAVVGMQTVISDRAAACFSGAFYHALSQREPLEQAVTAGRLSIFQDDETSGEWAAPVLFLRAHHGQLIQSSKTETTGTEGTSPSRVLGVYSFEGWGKEARTEALPKNILDLVPYFRGRYIRDPALWQVAASELNRFLPAAMTRGQEHEIELATHLSFAFTAGYTLESMSGYRLAIRQRNRDDMDLWTSQDGELPKPPGWSGLPLEEVPGAGSGGLAVAVSVSQKATAEIKTFLQGQRIPPSSLLVAELPVPSQGGIRNGAHAAYLAEGLHRKIKSLRPHGSQGAVHLFLAGPGGFAFFLGRLARDWGEIQLYEYDRDNEYPVAYLESVRLGWGRVL